MGRRKETSQIQLPKVPMLRPLRPHKVAREIGAIEGIPKYKPSTVLGTTSLWHHWSGTLGTSIRFQVPQFFRCNLRILKPPVAASATLSTKATGGYNKLVLSAASFCKALHKGTVRGAFFLYGLVQVHVHTNLSSPTVLSTIHQAHHRGSA